VTLIDTFDSIISLALVLVGIKARLDPIQSVSSQVQKNVALATNDVLFTANGIDGILLNESKKRTLQQLFVDRGMSLPQGF
jgi:hypothetical protein